MAPKVTTSSKMYNFMKQRKTKKRSAKKAGTVNEKSVNQFLRIVCPICFDNINKQRVSSTKCGHVFCTGCLQRALKRMSVCPTCRTRLKGPSGHHVLYLDTVCECDIDVKMQNTGGWDT